MTANPATEEKGLIEAAVAVLQAQLPSSWTVQQTSRTVAGNDPSRSPLQVDTMIDLQVPQGVSNSVIVEAKQSFTPRDAEQLFSGLARKYRALSSQFSLLVVAPWLSRRTQELLASDGVNYLDLTGNIRIALDYPTLFISSQGATRDPAPMARGKARVRGPKAGRLVRLLADVTPPYGVSQVAAATGLAPGYVSRLLEALSDEALIERSGRGQVISTDITGLLRRWAESYDVFEPNRSSAFVAPKGPAALLQDFAGSTAGVDLAVSGSFAAVRLAPIAAPALLVAYCRNIDEVATRFELLPADRGANLILLDPFDPVVWDRSTTDGGITYVAPSQIVVDCLTGNGRMPSEGDAVLAWMEEDESRWRLPSLESVVRKPTDP